MLRLLKQTSPRIPIRKYVTIRNQHLPIQIGKPGVIYARPILAPVLYAGIRFQSTKNGSSSTNPLDSNTTDSNTTSSNSNSNPTNTLKVDTPQLMIAFTCKKCDTRSSHTFSKQAYTKGSVLIQCPGCKNRHLIADNLKMFRDENVNLEQLLKLQGESVATTPDDLAFEDIPESLKKTLGHYAKDAPEEYKQKEEQRFLEAQRKEID